MMQWNGPCWIKASAASSSDEESVIEIGTKSMPFWEAWSRREGWMKLCSFLGAKAYPMRKRWAAAASDDDSIFIFLLLFLSVCLSVCVSSFLSPRLYGGFGSGRLRRSTVQGIRIGC